MITLKARDALSVARQNRYRSWNHSQSTSIRSEDPANASPRIYEGYASVMPRGTQSPLAKDAAVFAMGSCFAREVEHALIRSGGNVVSLDNRVQIDEFRDGDGRFRTTFFHRYTPRSIWQEFMWCFDQLDNWGPESLIFGRGESDRTDLNYCSVKGANRSLQAVLKRRQIASELVLNSAKADVIILTLGLVEAWYHKPSKLYANYADPSVIARNGDEFELHLLDVADTIECLEGINTLLHKKHETGNFRLILTVSPVPLQSTFTNDDVIVANAASKSTLRAAVNEFVAHHNDVDYFPSYEMVIHSAQELAWRPDRVHVNAAMVAHIVKTFRDTYYRHAP